MSIWKFFNISDGGLRRVVKRRTRRKASKKSIARYMEYKERSRVLVHSRLEYWNAHYGFTYKKVAIRNQKTRWGSCSKRGNLNFNYKIVLLPTLIADYIIVHELCHLREFNHKKSFWSLVGETIPDYENCIKQLKLESKKINSVV